jgi:hypothetical protein
MPMKNWEYIFFNMSNSSLHKKFGLSVERSDPNLFKKPDTGFKEQYSTTFDKKEAKIKYQKTSYDFRCPLFFAYHILHTEVANLNLKQLPCKIYANLFFNPP